MSQPLPMPELAEPIRLWSVTTLIDAGLGKGDGLLNFVARETAEGAIDHERAWKSRLENEGRESAIKFLTGLRFENLKKAALRGTDLHGVMEKIALGLPFDVPEGGEEYVPHLVRWVETFRPTFVMSEAPVYNAAEHYAGTLDGIVQLPDLPGRNVIYDLKTTKHGPDSGKTRPPFPEVALQLAAYARATEVGVISEQRYTGRGAKRYYLYDPAAKHEPMPPVDFALCIVLSPYDCFAVPVDIGPPVWKSFLHARECARFKLALAGGLFRPPLVAPREL